MIFFVRHGESEANVLNLFAGQRDNSKLTLKGREQAKQAGEELLRNDQKIALIVTFPLERAMDTAKIIAQVINYKKEEVRVDERIQEYDMGELSGEPRHKITSNQLISAKGAEEINSFSFRVQEALIEYSNSSENVLLVSHAGVSRIIRALETNTPSEQFYDLEALPNAHVTKLDS